MALSEEEKEFTKGYNEGYKDGLKDQLKPQEYRIEELRQKTLKEAVEEINDRLLNSKETTIGDIEAAVTLQKKVDKIQEYSEVKARVEDIKSALASTAAILLIGGIAWYFWSFIGFIVSLIYIILMWIGVYIQTVN